MLGYQASAGSKLSPRPQPKNLSPRARHGAEVHATDALNGPLAPADRDGPVRKPFSNWTVAVRTRDGAPRACCLLTVHVAPPPGPRTLDHILVCD